MITIDLRKYETLGRLFIRFGKMPASLQKRNANPGEVMDLLHDLTWLLSLLLKSEAMARHQFVDAEQFGPLLKADPLVHTQYIKEYLEQFASILFSFNRSERQTLVFVLENVMEFLRQQRDSEKSDESETASQFIDSRFWFENLFKMVDEKLSINLGRNKQKEWAIIDSDREITLAPFIISRGEETLLFHEISDKGAEYRTPEGQSFFINSEPEIIALAEYLVQNLAVRELEALSLPFSAKERSLLSVSEELGEALNLFQKGNWEQTIRSIDRIGDRVKIQNPLLIRMRIMSLLHMHHSSEALNEARLFLTHYPAYTSTYELIGEAYEQKEDYSAAMNAYERAAQFSRNRNLATRIKKLKQQTREKKEEPADSKGEYLIPVSISDEQQATMVRQPEILMQMEEILASQHRPNLLLIGDGGCGKTSIIRQFVMQLNDHPQWHSIFPFREVRTIQFVNLLTGSKYRGQFEEKVLALLNEAVRMKVLLVVEDVHLLFSQGGARGTALDFINIVRPFLAERRLQMVATTHFEELKNTLERDNAFLGCFHQLTVRPVSEKDTLEIMNRVGKYRQEQWGIAFPAELHAEILELSRQLLRSRAFPDAPLLLLDRVYAKMRLISLSDSRNAQDKMPRALLADTVKEMANLPAQLFGVTIQDRLVDFEERMAARIIGQRKVLSRLTSRITAYKRGFKIRSNRPDGVFLLVGPTGVGKTETSLVLAEELIGSRDALLRVDMSEYMEKFTYSRFIGAAPGYVGYNDTNQLTDKVRQNPMTIILLDEVEKADPQLLNIFLQVFDAGRLTDARGRVVDFSSTIVLMTSNVGTELYGASPLGYQEQGRQTRVAESSLLKTIKKRFSPEFLNRLDDILVFSPLGDREAVQIVSLQLESVKKKLLREGKLLMVTPSVSTFLAEQGVSPQYGARQLTRTITQALLEPLAVKAQSDEWSRGNLIHCDLENDSIKIVIQDEIPAKNGDLLIEEKNETKNREYELESEP